MVLSVVLLVAAAVWAGAILLVGALCSMAARGDRELVARQLPAAADSLVPAASRRAATPV